MKFMFGFFILAVSTALAAEEPHPKFTILTPQDYQVYQRETRTKGVVKFEAQHLHVSMDSMQYRFVGKPLDGEIGAAWNDLNADIDGEHFSGKLPVPAGGWYKLEVRLLKGGKSVFETSVEHVGVGEVFVIAGQSNSTNYGSEKQKTASLMVSSFDGKKWVLADDPQPGTADGSTGGSFAPAFGDALFEKYKVPIGVASTGAGATSVRQWLPKGERMKNPPTIESHVKKVEDGIWESTGGLFDGLMKRVNALGKNGFRAILWHQGESDAGQARGGYPAFKQISGAQYAAFMEKLIKGSREKASWDIPWFNALATYHSEKDAQDEEFRAAQKSLWEKGITHEGPDSDALRNEFRAGVHFNGKGLQAHGKLWAEKIGAYLESVLNK